MKTTDFTTAVLLFVGCHGSPGNPAPAPASEIVDSVVKNNALPADTIYAVYELSHQTTAVVVNFSETEIPGVLDSIFRKISITDSLTENLPSAVGNQLRNCYYADTLGRFKLMRSEKLEQAVKKRFNSELYVYGTKGYSKAKIGKVYFSLDECRTNLFALCIEGFDTTRLGRPVIASRKLLPLDYARDLTNAENAIASFYAGSPPDYSDSIKTKVFAAKDSFYLAYSDDFRWGREPASAHCLFPSRAIFIIGKNSRVKRHWTDGLDLFGIPCD